MSGEMNPILECRNLSKKYNHQTYALNDLSLSLGRGQIVGLLGPNGERKNYPDQADQRAFDPFRRFCADRRMAPGVDTKKLISYLPERSYLDDSMKVKDIIHYFTDFL